MEESFDGSSQRGRFVTFAELGRNDWWRYVIGFALIVGIGLAVGFVLVGSLLTIGVVLGIEGLENNIIVADPSFVLSNPLTSAMSLALILLSFAGFLLATFLVVDFLHQRPWRTLLSGGAQFNWAGFVVSLLVVLAVSPIELFAEFFSEEPDVVIDFRPQAFLMFAVASIAFFPVQIMAEEVFFRGYLLQGVAVFAKRYVPALVVPAILIIPAVLFAAVHVSNTEVIGGGAWVLVLYGVIGVYLSFLVLRGDGLEYAAGFHLGNNLVAALLVTTPDSSFATPAIFRVGEVDWGPEILMGTVVLFAIHYLFVFVVLGPLHDRRAG